MGLSKGLGVGRCILFESLSKIQGVLLHFSVVYAKNEVLP